jgi:RNA recognition motif-containing protein
MASTKLYVGNLFYELTQQDVEAEFGKFGPIEQCAVKKGYAFVHYEQLEDAEMAVREMNDKELGGRRLRVAFAVSHGTQRRFDGPPGPPPMALERRPPGPPLLHSPRLPASSASPNLFVANIPPHIRMSQLDEAFAEFGEVKNIKVLPQARPDAPMSAFVDYTDVVSAQKAHSATILVENQHLRTDYNFRKNRGGDGPKRMSRGSFDGNGSYDGEERGGRPRYDSFDSQPARRSSRFEEEVEDPGRRHHHRDSSRHHSSRHSREDPEERGRSGSPPHYRRHSSSSMRRGEEPSSMRERSREFPSERSYARPDEGEEFQQPGRPAYYEPRGREERVPREYAGRGMDKEYRRYSRPEMTSSRHGSRRPRNDRSWYEKLLWLVGRKAAVLTDVCCAHAVDNCAAGPLRRLRRPGRAAEAANDVAQDAIAVEDWWLASLFLAGLDYCGESAQWSGVAREECTQRSPVVFRNEMDKCSVVAAFGPRQLAGRFPFLFRGHWVDCSLKCVQTAGECVLRNWKSLWKAWMCSRIYSLVLASSINAWMEQVWRRIALNG